MRSTLFRVKKQTSTNVVDTTFKSGFWYCQLCESYFLILIWGFPIHQSVMMTIVNVQVKQGKRPPKVIESRIQIFDRKVFSNVVFRIYSFNNEEIPSNLSKNNKISKLFWAVACITVYQLMQDQCSHSDTVLEERAQKGASVLIQSSHWKYYKQM